LQIRTAAVQNELQLALTTARETVGGWSGFSSLQSPHSSAAAAEEEEEKMTTMTID